MIPPDQKQIIDAAFSLAHQHGWANILISDVAKRLNCSISAIHCQFRSKDDIAEAWFDTVDSKTLQACEQQIETVNDPQQRLQLCIMTWFRQLQPHKKLVKDILLYKLEPGHLHLQAHGITRVSRTVQWFLDVCQRKYPGIEQIYDEATVTAAYLASFTKFFSDDSTDLQQTQRRLQRILTLAQLGHDLIGRFNRNTANAKPPNSESS